MQELDTKLAQYDIATSKYIRSLLDYPYKSVEQYNSAFKDILKTESDLSFFKNYVKIQAKEKIPLEVPFTIKSTVTEQNIIDKLEENKVQASDSSWDDEFKGDFKGDLHFEDVDLAMGNLKILEQATFKIVKGRVYGLVGRNGIGKSTLLKAIRQRQFGVSKGLNMHLVKQETKIPNMSVIDFVLYGEKQKSGNKHVNTDDIKNKHISTDDMNKLEQQLDELRIEENESTNINNAAEETNKGKKVEETKFNNKEEETNIDNTAEDLVEEHELQRKAHSILSGLGFTRQKFDVNLRDLSGGWAVRASLARAFFLEPFLFMLDEPTNHLDIESIAWLETMIQKSNSTFVIVSHDREFLNNVCTDILLLRDMKICEFKGNYDNFVTQYEIQKNLHQKSYEKQKQERQHIQEFIDKFRYNAKRASLVQSRIKLLNSLPKIEIIKADSIVKFKFEGVQSRGVLAELQNVSFGYTEKLILANINLKIDNKSRFIIVGPNGTGKSTFLKLLCQKLQPQSGSLVTHALRPAYFTQHHIDQLDTKQRILESIANNVNDERIRAVLSNFGLAQHHQKISTLSGGQKSRLAFAKLSMIKPNLLILDEPTNHLDIESIDALAEALVEFEGAVVCVSHDLKFVERVFKDIYVCNNGKLEYFKGTMRDYKAQCKKQ